MNNKIIFYILVIFLVTISACNRIGANTTNFNGIVSENSVLEKVTEGYIFDTAGSPLHVNGALYFTNNNFDSQEQLSRTFRKNSDGSIDTLKSGNDVTTTLRASGQGIIYACEMLSHRVVELDQNGQVLNIVADEYNGSRIDGPNDLVVDQKWGLYFSDSQFITGTQTMQPAPSLYYVSAEGEVIRLIDYVRFSNDLDLSLGGGSLDSVRGKAFQKIRDKVGLPGHKSY